MQTENSTAFNGLVSKGYGLHLFQPEWFEKKKDDKKPFKSPTVIPGN